VSSAGGNRVLITGAGGQLGRELIGTVPPDWVLLPYTSAELDVSRSDMVADVLSRERPSLVINAAAYTAVDAAEREPEVAEAVNARGAGHVAGECRRLGARLIHLSTDYVFDGAQGHPYLPEDPPRPLGVYGRTKLLGEREVTRLSGGDALILRTAWLYSRQGRNFVLTMLRHMQERDEIGVVCDQVGTPTWCRSLAEAIWAAAERPGLKGIHHWTDDGVASWYDFAVAIQEEARTLGDLRRALPIRRLLTSEYPTAAPRPSYSVLDASATSAALDLPRRHWRSNLHLMMRELHILMQELGHG
jgi:dTDP-4-dehydrorhamnose reductase